MKNLTAQDKLAIQDAFRYFKRVHGYCPSKISDFPPRAFSKDELPYVKRYLKELNKRRNPEPILPTTLTLVYDRNRTAFGGKPYRIEDSNNKIIWEGWWDEMPIEVPDTYQPLLDKRKSIELKDPLFKGGWTYHPQYGWDHPDRDDGTKKSEELRNLQIMKAVVHSMGVQQQKAWDEWDWDKFKRNPLPFEPHEYAGQWRKTPGSQEFTRPPLTFRIILKKGQYGNVYRVTHNMPELVNIIRDQSPEWVKMEKAYPTEIDLHKFFGVAVSGDRDSGIFTHPNGKKLFFWEREFNIPRIELILYLGQYALQDATNNKILWAGEWQDLPIKLDKRYQLMVEKDGKVPLGNLADEFYKSMQVR